MGKAPLQALTEAEQLFIHKCSYPHSVPWSKDSNAVLREGPSPHGSAEQLATTIKYSCRPRCIPSGNHSIAKPPHRFGIPSLLEIRINKTLPVCLLPA